MNGYFNKRSVYPGYNEGVSTLDKTIPDAEEQRSVAQVQAADIADTPVKDKKSIWMWLGILLMFIILSNMGGKI